MYTSTLLMKTREDALGRCTVRKRDLQRIGVLTKFLAGKRATASAAAVLSVSVRQTQRLLTRYRNAPIDERGECLSGPDRSDLRTFEALFLAEGAIPGDIRHARCHRTIQHVVGVGPENEPPRRIRIVDYSDQ
jgi:hypothetical protein